MSDTTFEGKKHQPKFKGRTLHLIHLPNDANLQNKSFLTFPIYFIAGWASFLGTLPEKRENKEVVHTAW